MILGTVTALYAATLTGNLRNPLGDRFDFGAIIDANVILLVTAVAVRFLRRQFAESLQRARGSERQMRAIFETSPESITLLDQQGNIVAANPQAAESLGVRRGGLDGRNALELLVPADRGRALVELERVRAGAMVRDERLDFRHTDGRVVPGEVSAAPLHDDHGKAIGIVVQSRDITERLPGPGEPRPAAAAAAAGPEDGVDGAAGRRRGPRLQQHPHHHRSRRAALLGTRQLGGDARHGSTIWPRRAIAGGADAAAPGLQPARGGGAARARPGGLLCESHKILGRLLGEDIARLEVDEPPRGQSTPAVGRR